MTFLTTVGGRKLTTVAGQRIIVSGNPPTPAAPYYPPSAGDLLTTESGVQITTGSGVDIAAAVRTSNNDIQLFSFYVDLLAAILWQYNNASSLQQLIAGKQAWYDENQGQFWQDWITNVFDLRTADEFGLAVWAIILGVRLTSSTPYDPSIPTFGFESASDQVNFDNGILQDQNGNFFVLPVNTRRILLQFRYFDLVSSGTVPEINRFLAYIFGAGKAWLLDHHDMTQLYVFNFPVSGDLAFMFNNFDVLPRPAGVGSSWVDATLSYFGFDENHLSFDQGILAPS